MLTNIIVSIKEYLSQSSRISILKFNIYHAYSFGWVAVIAHPTFWFIWTYLQPQEENIYLRLFGVLTSVVMLLMVYNRKRCDKIIKYFWIFMVFYNLPFFFTSNLLINQYNDTWLMAEIVMIFVIIIFIPNVLMSLALMLIGVGSAFLLTPTYYDYPIYSLDSFLRHLPMYLLSILSAHIFSYATIVGEKARAQAESFKSLAGSIAHELRNPLSSIRMSAAAVDINKDYLDRSKLKNLTKEQLEEIVFNEATEVSIHKSHLDKSVNLANSVIDMTLADLSGKEVDKDSYKYIDTYKATSDALEVFAFKDQEERERVFINLDNKNNFIFKGSDTAFYYILFNLVKNALYYVKDQPNLTITISTALTSNKKTFKTLDPSLSLDKSKIYNVLIIEDTGPGIPADILAKLFGSFVTSGKKEGTGLGLAFCKRTMIDFGGDISCESEVGKYTRFNLYFPALDKEELVSAKEVLNNLKAQYSAISNEIPGKKTLAIPKKSF